MSDKDDPFGLSNDAGRTRIRPMRSDRATPPSASGAGTVAIPQGPGSSSPQAAGAFSAASQPGGRAAWASAAPTGTARVRHARAHPNPLVSSFAALLEFAPELERASPPAQAEALRVRLYDNLIDARDAAIGMGIPMTRANQAAWFVAALLDDLALNTPWGGHSDWPRQPLVTQLSGEVDAGTRYFERLEEMIRFPARDPQVLEIAGLGLTLGFRGKYRLQGGAGDGALLALRTQATRALRNRDGEDPALSPHWQGVNAPDTPRRFAVPVWTVAIGAGALMLAIYAGLAIQLSSKAEQLFALADRVPPSERAEIFRPVRETVAPVPEITITPPVIELLPVFDANLPADLKPAVQGHEDTSLTVLVLQAKDPEIFKSAKADLNAVYAPLVQSIATTIIDNAEVIGAIKIIGHTDNVPVQRTNPFASNQGLSEARAATIAGLLAAAGVPAALIASEGHADTEPVGDNTTKAGRAQNRRVEIRIEKRL